MEKGYRERTVFESDLARISHSPSAATAYLTASSGFGLIADFDVLQYAFTRLTAPNPENYSFPGAT